HYTFSSNQAFTAAGATDPANQGTAFSGFGTTILTLSGLAQYGTGIVITDTGSNASVLFADSANNSYSNNITVTLSNASAGAVSFSGQSSFGAFNLQAA